MKQSKKTQDAWVADFSAPAAVYRAKPFWAWNGRLAEREIRRQVRRLEKMGFGGFFMHARTGLATPYLSREWFRMVGAGIDAAARCGLEAWLYDEDRWPSGAAGGLATKKTEFRMKYLEMTIDPSGGDFAGDKDQIAVFAVRLQAGRIRAVRRARRPGRPAVKTGWKRLGFRVKPHACRDWFNGQTYLDVLNPQAVRAFIGLTHENYRKHAGAFFGKTVPGIFTDEPAFSMVFKPEGCVLPWTAALPEVFKRRYGYDLRAHLPELFFLPERVNFSRVRCHYIDCLSWMFTQAFARQIGAWCAQNRLLFTGHVLYEDSLREQTAWVGSAMRFYEHMQAPGMDLLGEHWRGYDAAKQVSSVARQFGRKWRLSETGGGTGWDFTFAGHKALGDWQAALGINLRCPHLAWYTMEGEAKRDWPGSIFYQSPWWRDYRIIEDYFARINAVMTRGREVRDLLVIHPLESLWGVCRISAPGWINDPAAVRADRRLRAVRDALLRNHIDFDYGDEDIISRHGSVQPGSGPEFVVGKAAYRAVLVPPLATIRASTLALLKRFKSAGGQVVFHGRPPKYVDARPARAAREFARQCAPAAGRPRNFIRALEGRCRRVSVADAGGNEIPAVLYLLKSDADFFYLFLCNTGHSRCQLDLPPKRDVAVAKRQTGFARVFIRGFGECRGAPLELDPASGKVWTAAAARRRGCWEIKTAFPPLGSRLFVIPRRKSPGVFPPRPEWKIVKRRRIAKSRWPVALSEHNCLVLDRPRYKINAVAWKGPEEILRLDGKVRAALGWPLRNGEMQQPWAQQLKTDAKKATIELQYEFDLATLPAGNVFLAVERPGLYAIALNGVSIAAAADAGWWVDPALRKLTLPAGALRAGRNVIALACEYTRRHPGLEIIYLLGQFGVRLRRERGCLTAVPRFLRPGNWVRQGLPFYSGSIAYTCRIRRAARPGQRVVLNVPDYAGAAVKIWVDGRLAGYAAWPPWQVDITGLLDNKNRWHELRLEVLGHRRNSHGPLHRAGQKFFTTNPHSFHTRGVAWRRDHQLVPCGLQRPPELLTYAMVKTV